MLFFSWSRREDESDDLDATIQSTVPSPSSLSFPFFMCSPVRLRMLLVSPTYLTLLELSLMRYSPGALGGLDPCPVKGSHLFGRVRSRLSWYT